MNVKDMQSSFQFVGSKVTSCHMKNDFVSTDGLLPLKCTVEYTVEPPHIDENLNVTFGIITLFVNASVSDKESKGKFSCKLVLEGCFSDSAECDKENFLKMLRINGCTLLYSSARAYISTISGLSVSGGNVNLPMVNCFKMVEKGEKRIDSVK